MREEELRKDIIKRNAAVQEQRVFYEDAIKAGVDDGKDVLTVHASGAQNLGNSVNTKVVVVQGKMMG